MFVCIWWIREDAVCSMMGRRRSLRLLTAYKTVCISNNDNNNHYNNDNNNNNYNIYNYNNDKSNNNAKI